MAAKIIDGKAIAEAVRSELKERVAALSAKGTTPGLGVILVGDNPASRSYVTAKERACESIGIYSDDNRLPADTSETDLLTKILVFMEFLSSYRFRSILMNQRFCWPLILQRT